MLRTAFCMIVALGVFVSVALAGADEDAVRRLLHLNFDKPETRLVVQPVIVVSDQAIAGWTQGDMGGQALLRNRHGRWTLILCAGDALKSREALIQVGIAPVDAGRLASDLAVAEAQLDPGVVAMFSRFEGLVTMDDPVHGKP